MSSVAVFVDAGYLFAQGSAAITGASKPRNCVTLNETAVVAELTNVANVKARGLPLLRIYWYDAARGSRGLTLDHATLAHTDYIKLHLGFLSSQKQQKGVDSLIVTDLIELARNHAMSDAVLISGDEDVRIGVQIAQGFGVRIHLLGIQPSRGSQSLQLLQEADTTTEWDASVVSRFLTVQAPAAASSLHTPSTSSASSFPQSGTTTATSQLFETVIANLVNSLDSNAISHLKTFWQSQYGLPHEIDGKLIARCRSEIGVDLDQIQKRTVRRRFTAAVKALGP
jgi:uncharacterized LabA/DUF88 family protein